MKEKMKEIWGAWWKSTKESATKSWVAIRNVCKTTFHLIKEPIIALVDGLFEWAKALVLGIFDIIVAFVSVFLTSLASAICQTVYQLCVCLKEWIAKW